MSKKKILEDVKEYVEKEFPKKRFIAGKTIIPASGASISPDDISSIVESALQGWFTDFKFCEKFRQEISKVTGKKYVVLTNSGSSASLLAITACLEKYKWGDQVITTAVGFPTTVAPIVQNNMTPRFIDIDPSTLSPSRDQCEEVLDMAWEGIVGSIFAHTLGFPFRTTEFLIGEGKKFLISDTADALGIPIDYTGDAITLSFFPAHQITTGEGGAVCTDDKGLFTLLQSYANWGRDCYCKPGQSNTCGKRFEHEFKNMPRGYDHKYTFSRFGYNLKITEMQAALGLSQIKRLPEFVKARRFNYDRLVIGFPKKASEYFDLIEVPEWSKPSPFGFPMVRKSGSPFQLPEFISYLEQHKISTRRLFGGNLTRQPMFDHWGEVGQDLSGSNKLMNDLVWIGCHPGIDNEMIDYMLEIIESFFVERGL
jgi:CDP-6-deoxy-D-xylo-4-hexulose-3-dehydrase